MIENSKGKMAIHAVVEHMAMENERFRGLLTRCDEYLAEKGVIRDAKLRREIRAALNQQAEPSTVVAPFDLNEFARRSGQVMAEHDFHGFEPIALAIAEELLGVQAEPAPAQDEREAVAAALASADWPNVSIGNKALIMRAICLLSSPAQTEQQPVIVREGWKLVPIEPTDDMIRSAMQYDSAQEPGEDPDLAESLRVDWSLMLYAAPVAQDGPQDGTVIAYRTLDRHGNAVTDWIDGDPAGGEPIVPGGSFQLAYSAPQPEQSGLVEALSEAVEALQEAGDFRAAGKGEKALSSYHAALSAQGASK